MDADLRLVGRNRLAEQITGGLSWPSKMPSPAWGIPATRCRVGSVLAQREGTVCHDCYALKGRYLFPTVQRKLEERYRGLFHPLWTPAMVFLVRYYADRYFRFFDSGDLQGENHLRNICTIAAHCPDIRFWLPTREAAAVRAVGSWPPNLTVRVSAPLVDGPPPRGFANTSTVASRAPQGHSFVCPAPDQGGHCGTCRACWSKEVPTVAYRLH
jgi:hypothetical protein